MHPKHQRRTPPKAAPHDETDRSKATSNKTNGSDSGFPDLKTLIRRNLIRLAISLVALGALAGGLVVHFSEELDAVTSFVFQHLGLGGVVLVIFITDSFISPLPPDSLLVLIAASEHASSWPVLIPAIGLVSSVAGLFGYACGRFLARRPLAKTILDPFHAKSQELVVRYGGWGVAIGAMTPVPFSITCWTAGLLEVPSRSIWLPCLLRIPRYVIYYVVITLGERAFS